MVQVALHAEDFSRTRSSDPVFGIAAGLSLFLLLSPIILLLASVSGVTGLAALYGTFLATGTGAITLAGLVFSRRPGLVTDLGATDLTWLQAVLGVIVAVGSFATYEFGGRISVLGAFLGLLATLFGFLLGVLARSRYAAAVLASVPEQAVFEAGWPDDPGIGSSPSRASARPSPGSVSSSGLPSGRTG